uniref:Uncharacterized protein n=1 Tax=Strombidium inclinatum TaxID=197538 RepID=A0A7S3MZB4_9SPIT|mmetsp:Transcript_31183/g.47740  ORF Transcript_31183/g.47740 Transcript_31183/m.47740 type:complete len:229 (+) Transcript_31183:504-1190(+)
MIAEALEKNDDVKLEEFYASRDRLEDPGMEAMAKVFSKQKCLRKIEVYQNGSKKGLRALLLSLAECKDTLKSVNIQDNKSINKAVDELITFIGACKELEYLNISDNKMRKKYCKKVIPAIMQALKDGSKLSDFQWNFDLACSSTLAKQFLSELSEVDSNLKKVALAGVFQLRETRGTLKESLQSKNIDLELFKPDFTDDESEDHDNSEEESQASDKSDSATNSEDEEN